MRTNSIGPGHKLWHALSDKDVLSELDTDLSGLSGCEAADRLQRYGANTLHRMGKESA